MLKLISWNVHSDLKNVSKQVETLSNRDPHVVALQEVTARSAVLFEKELARIGLPHVAHTFQDTSEKEPSGVLTASRFELKQLPQLPGSELWPSGVHPTR